MISRNYLKTSFRSLRKNKLFSFINIAGLSFGTLCCLYILLYVQDQYSYDRHHTDGKDIYRVNALMSYGGKSNNSSTISPAIAPAMKNDFSEVKQFTRVVGNGSSSKQNLLQYGDKLIYESAVFYADSTFFDVFTYHFLQGNPHTALTEPYSVVLSKSTADRIFGLEDPMGKLIQINNSDSKDPYKITAVVDERLGKSHINGNVFITMNSGGMGAYTLRDNSWAGSNYTASYVKLQSGTDIGSLQKKFPGFLAKYGEEDLRKRAMKKELQLQPISSIHTTLGHDHEITRPVSASFLALLLLIAALIQVIACINFMNLSTARASQRAKEVGIRKVIGAGKMDLVRQFLGESLLLALTGIIVAVPLLVLALPSLNSLTHSHIGSTFLLDYRIWLVLAGLVVFTGLFAGSYPAFYLSAFQAIKVIKGNFTSHLSSGNIRRSLVVFQFTLSIILITGIIVIYSQLNFINNKDLGFDKDQQVVFSFNTDDANARIPAFMNDLRQLSEINAVSRANNYLSQNVPNDRIFYRAGGNTASGEDAQMIFSDEFFVNTSGIRIISGRDFRQNDSGKVLINETMAKKMGLDIRSAPGTLLYTEPDPGKPVNRVEVAGVMKDFNFNSLYKELNSFMLQYDNSRTDRTNVIVNTNTKNYKQLLAKIEAVWHTRFQGLPFSFVFVNDQVQKQYEAEITLVRIVNSFTIMAIIISCLGLLGLAAFSAEQRTKEIGVRKVLGASISGIVRLLSKDFIQLVVVAFLIASPVSWWAMNKWLQGFAYRINISWWMLGLSGVLAVFIALITVSSQAIKAAVANPVKSLRSE